MLLFIQKIATEFMKECGELPPYLLLPKSSYLKLVREINDIGLHYTIRDKTFTFQEQAVTINTVAGPLLVRYEE